MGDDSRFSGSVLKCWSCCTLFIVCTFGLFGCGDQSGVSTELDAVAIRWHISGPDLQADAASERSASIWETCDAENIPYVRGFVYEEPTKELITFETFACAAGKGIIDGVKPNTDIRVVLVGLDEDDNIIYRGQLENLIQVAPGDTKRLDKVISIHPMLPTDPDSDFEVEPDGAQITIKWTKPHEKAYITEYAFFNDHDLKTPIKICPVPEEGTEDRFTATIGPIEPVMKHCFYISAKDKFGNASKLSNSLCGTTEKLYTKLDEAGNAFYDANQQGAMVRDEHTNLIWEVKKTDDDTSPHYHHNMYYKNENENVDESVNGIGSEEWTKAFIDGLNTARFGGFDDWRLPTIKELFSIVETEEKFRGRWNDELAINMSYFPNISYSSDPPVPAKYWTSTKSPYFRSLSRFFPVGFGEGGRNYSYEIKDENGAPVQAFPVRAVRGDPETDSPDYSKFTDNNDGTITDGGTGLMWQKAITRASLWEDARNASNKLNENKFAEYEDWRIPTIRELLSIMDYTRSPTINGDLFDYVDNEEELACFWSCTKSLRTVEPGHEYVYVANFLNGNIYDRWDKVEPTIGDEERKKKTHYVRAVRNVSGIEVTVTR